MWTILGARFTSLDLVFGGIFLVLLFKLVTQRRQVPKGPRLPPGPPRKLIVGNALDIPSQHEWTTFTRWAKQYGNLVYIEMYGKSMVIVNSMDVARDLFEKRSSLYSDRFDFPMLNDLIGLNWSFAHMHYGDFWRRHRKVFHQHFHPAASATYHNIQIKHTRDLLRRLHESPDSFIDHFRHFTGATIIEIVYGFKVLSTGDPYIELGEKVGGIVSAVGKPGTYLVDVLPILKYVPAWMPGASFQRKARVWRVAVTDMAVLPFMAVKQALSAGTAGPSVIASLLEELSDQTDESADQEEIIRNAGAVAYGAGSETVASALACFMLCMILYPETQRKAQAELDSMIGTGRLPNFDDRENLPYTNALCKEVLRWHPVTPLGVAHRVMEDDVYGDYIIPGGSIVLGNAWAILHDEKNYGPETGEFKPERFLVPGIPDPAAAFGFGRRQLPGQNMSWTYMAVNSIFIVVASILKAFDLCHANDSAGNKIYFEPSFTTGSTSHPEPFRCQIKPRSPRAEELIWDRNDD